MINWKNCQVAALQEKLLCNAINTFCQVSGKEGWGPFNLGTLSKRFWFLKLFTTFFIHLKRWPGLPSNHLSQPVSVLMAASQKTSGSTPIFHSERHFRMISSNSQSAVHQSNEFTPFRSKNKRRLNETFEDMEGLKALFFFLRRYKFGTIITLFSDLLPNESKRSKLDVCSQLMTPSTVRLMSFVNQSILSVLDTPTIKSVKKTPFERTALNKSATPHSILKLQRGKSESPAPNKFLEAR
jgi:hypothetical protein